MSATATDDELAKRIFVPEKVDMIQRRETKIRDFWYGRIDTPMTRKCHIIQVVSSSQKKIGRGQDGKENKRIYS